jgi:hypothetical protein
MTRFLLLRLPLLLLAGLAAGTAAWWLVQDQAPVYEQTLTFVLRPSASITDAQIPDAVRGLSQQDAQLVNTIGGAIGSQRFLVDALDAARVDDRDAYSARSSVRPGSDIVELHLQGPDPEGLESVADRYETRASRWVDDVYRAYTLEFLEADASSGPVAPRTEQLVSLAALLGALLAGGVILAEWKARRRFAPAEQPRRPEPTQDVLVEDSTGRVDRLEALLRSYAENGEDVVREGPQRLRIVRRSPVREGVRGRPRRA